MCLLCEGTVPNAVIGRDLVVNELIKSSRYAPAKFSEPQIQSYLKTVAYRREIDEAQKASAGRGVGGVQTSRI
ncbi:hypothetical protein C5167_026886 [Papaver somniferum]|nr:hypothetical protein C5167_026886 [Papaver somniferum]